jgi:quercetin dioxygenase-like cupin family protein
MFLKMISMLGLCAVLIANVCAQEIKRKIISRADLTGTNMEVIMVETELPPGVTSPRHTHPGEEAYYVVEGGTVQFPGEEPKLREPGTGGINKREMPHAGYKVVGDKTIKIVSVYIVDKGKPLATPAPQEAK